MNASTTLTTPKIALRQKIIFGFGSAFFLGLPACIFLPNPSSLILLFVFSLFFLVGYFFSKLFLNRFTGLLGRTVDEKDFEDVPGFQWKSFTAAALFISFLLICIEFFI